MEDDSKLHRKIDAILLDVLESEARRGPLVEMLSMFRNPIKSQFDFKNMNEYHAYCRRGDLRTLNGEKVKSFGEVQVANILALNGVKYEYEADYAVSVATSRHRQYRPDFYLPDYDLYVEHLALDEKGNAPDQFRDYVSSVNWKRNIHSKYGTKLIETYDHQFVKGTLQRELEASLTECGVEFKPTPSSKLLDELRKLTRSWLSRLVAVFLKHVKNQGVSLETLVSRVDADDYRGIRERAFLNVFEYVMTRYDQALASEDVIDFEDMIGKAAKHLRDGTCKVFV